MRKGKVTCETCTEYQRLLYLNDDGVMDVEKVCTYKEKILTPEEIENPCEDYEERWDE